MLAMKVKDKNSMPIMEIKPKLIKEIMNLYTGNPLKREP